MLNLGKQLGWAMELRKPKHLLLMFVSFVLLISFQNCTSNSPEAVSTPETPQGCTTLTCQAAKYSLIASDFDGANLSLVRTSAYQEMTHPRVTNDKNWIAYTAYNDLDSHNCASLEKGYLNTEIRAVQISGVGDKRIIAPTAGQFNSNSYWIGTTNEFSYLSGPPSALKFYRAAVNSSMSLISGPTQIPVPGTIVPMDPATHLATNKIVFPGLYNPGGGFVKSIFLMNLSDGGNLVGLSLGRDRAGTPIICIDACANIMENDPKISPDGTKVAFMRQAPDSGGNRFGWHIFVVPVASPLGETDISYSHLGSNLFKNDVLPEWIDDTTLIFSTIELSVGAETIKNVYTMKSDGSQRTKISLPSGFRYSDVFPFTDANGKKRMILSAEKLDAVCKP